MEGEKEKELRKRLEERLSQYKPLIGEYMREIIDIVVEVVKETATP